MRILIIDNTIEPPYWSSANLRKFGRLAPGSTVVTRRAPQGDLPASPEGFDAVIASGSKTGASEHAPWIDALLAFIRATVERDVPYLGVCYGHQMLARALGGDPSVRRGERGEHGWTRIEQTTGDAPLFRGLPKTFHSLSSHYDEVAALPAGTRLLARSEACATQAFEVTGKRAFGIQFHPEKDIEDAERLFAEERQKGNGPRLLFPKESAKYYDENVGLTLMRNFLGLAGIPAATIPS